MIKAVTAAFLMSCAASMGAAQGFKLIAPVDCSLGDECYIQQYVDHDQSEGAQDFQCADLSYDGHSGTDFALHTVQQMYDGVDVIAAASGVVTGVRRSEEDVIHTAESSGKITERECGNGVAIRHQDGWSTRYCHMKKDTVSVQKGQVVRAGTTLGQIGLSGRTQFPHLHLTVLKDGKVVDPFDPDGKISCQSPDPDTLWETPLPTPIGGMLYTGFSNRIPEYVDIKSGEAAMQSLPSDAPAVVTFGFGFGAQKGDVVHLVLSGPDGVMLEKKFLHKKNKAQFFRAIGKKLKTESWAAGEYSGSVSLIRDGQVLDTEFTQIIIQ